MYICVTQPQWVKWHHLAIEIMISRETCQKTYNSKKIWSEFWPIVAWAFEGTIKSQFGSCICGTSTCRPGVKDLMVEIRLLRPYQPKVSWWPHQMDTFSALLAICAGNSPVSGEFPAQRPVTQSFDVSLIFGRINGWVNNHEAGHFRRYHAHYDVTVMWVEMWKVWPQ